MEPPLHIASLIVHVQPDRLEAVVANLRRLDGLELYPHSAGGKLVVVLEADHERQIPRCIEQIGDLPGVLDVALVYHERLSPEGTAR